MAERRELTAKTRLYDDDMYSDFDVVEEECLSGTPSLVEAIRTSQLSRRIPSTTNTASRSSVAQSALRRAPAIEGVIARDRPLGMFGAEEHSAPPLTAVNRAGYSSVGGNVSRPN